MADYVYFIVLICYLAQNRLSNAEEEFAKAFQNQLIVPNLLDSPPDELSPIVYKPGLIILTGKPYFPYQIKGLPDISWNHKDETYYTIIILGALQQQKVKPDADNSRISKKITTSPPEHSWHQWVKINIFENCIDSTGTELKPYLESNALEPNSTHSVLYVIVIYEQNEKLQLNLDDKNNSADGLLKRYFTPVKSFEKNFPRCNLLAGNFFYVIEKFKLNAGIREDLFDPKALKLKKTVESARKDNYRYFGL